MNNDLKELQEKLNYDKTFDCVQCGFCLPACPTYETMNTETHSPRGRINLVKMAAEGKITLDDLADPIEKCLGCRACEVVCPTNVEYGKILEGAKETLSQHQTKKGQTKPIENYIFNQVFPSRKWLDFIGNATWVYQLTGMDRLIRQTRLSKLLPMNLDQFERVLPKVSAPNQRHIAGKTFPAIGEKRATVGLVLGCVMDAMFHQTNLNTIQLLRLSGAEVFVPERQTCCGALHSHSGDMEQARKLAKRNIAAFEEIGVDYVVNNAGGCGAMLNEYASLLESEPDWKGRATDFSAKSKDISVVLNELDALTFKKELTKRVTYQPSCHMSNVQKVKDEPVNLLKNIPGIEFKEMSDQDKCCGSAGIYNMIHYEESMKILDKKMPNVKEQEPEVIITTNPGCLLQMKLGVEREGLTEKVRVLHLVDFLTEAVPQQKQRDGSRASIEMANG